MARIGQFSRLAKSAGVCRNPQQHAGTGAIRQEKTPTENGWGFIIGGGGGNRTHVRKLSTFGSTCLAQSLVLTGDRPTGRAARRRARKGFNGSAPGGLRRDPASGYP